jgi:hypothetical protein
MPSTDVFEKFVFRADLVVALQVIHHLREKSLTQPFKVHRFGCWGPSQVEMRHLGALRHAVLVD